MGVASHGVPGAERPPGGPGPYIWARAPGPAPDGPIAGRLCEVMARRASVGERISSGNDHDRSLVRDLVKGDLEALGELYDRHSPVMLGVAARVLGSAGDAEDLVHDVFIEAWQRVSDYDPRRGSVRAWLLVRVRSRAIDRLRSLRVAREAGRARSAATGPTLAPSPDPALLQEWRHAQAALEGLSALQRQTLEMAYFQGLSARDIARHCGIPEGTAKSRLAGALRAVRRALVPPRPGGDS